MHYKNGRPAKNGDPIVSLPPYTGAQPVVGFLYAAAPGNDACNGRIAVAHPSDTYANLSECLHIDDVKSVLSGAVPDISKVA